MIINVNNIIKGTSEIVKFSSELYLPDFKLLLPNVPVDVQGTLFNDGNGYIFSAKVNANLHFQCYSCLEPFILPISFELNEVYSKNNIDEEVLPFSTKDSIDFTEAIKTNIILNLPMKAICSHNCKGLCYICGQNLNLNDCSCDTSYINPKFEKFLELFNQNDKEV